jgi:glycosyltransferase involved in cell wall biosynthesis
LLQKTGFLLQAGSTVSQPLLLQPAAGGRISGGFLYNARMAEHGLWELRDVPAHALPELASQSADQPLLLDSIWLSEAHAPPFLALAAQGRRVGVMLHSFPSFIRAAEAGEPAPAAPSPFEREAIARLGVVVVPGNHYTPHLAASGARMALAEPGLDDGWRAPPRPRRGPCRLVSVGAVTPRKGFLDVAELLQRRVGASDYVWRVLGSLDVDPGYAQRVVERTRALPGVQLLGQRAPLEVQREVCSADLLLMPSYDENQPLVLLEALAASVPAIAYAAGAARHMLEHEREGLIAPIGDRTRFGAYLEQLLADEPRRQQLAAACWLRQERLPSWPVAVERARQALARAWAA